MPYLKTLHNPCTDSVATFLVPEPFQWFLSSNGFWHKMVFVIQWFLTSCMSVGRSVRHRLYHYAGIWLVPHQPKEQCLHVKLTQV